MICTAKHTKYQPPDEKWFCPRCGAGDAFFCIDEQDPEASPNCQKLHENDYIICTNCNHKWSGKQLAKAMMKRDTMVVCPLCKGKGYIPEAPQQNNRSRDNRD